ncbi:hypothetical protein ACVWXU_003148 [Streptomyces sp. TE33382]
MGAAIMMTSLEPCTRERKWFSFWASSWVREMLSRSMIPCRTTRARTTVQPVRTTTWSTRRPSTTLYRMPRVQTAAARYGVSAARDPAIGRLVVARGWPSDRSALRALRRAPQGA